MMIVESQALRLDGMQRSIMQASAVPAPSYHRPFFRTG